MLLKNKSNRHFHGTVFTKEAKKAANFHKLVAKHGGSSVGDRFSVPRHNLANFKSEAHESGYGNEHGSHYRLTNSHTKPIDEVTQHTEQPASYLEHLKQGGLPHEYKGPTSDQ